MIELEFEEAPMWTVFYRDLWGPVWPNLAASLLWAPAAFAWHHRRIRAHISNVVAEAAGLVGES
ncbi:MAG: hypothetical protein E6J20_18120 [Chloroflexi bacterium]|nr:MAG: hypothetical protein E6J20_18120 [Chloroflexota bacterium]